jgi:dTDP-4-amino-4,6-dideoxygalactose transaminase
MAVLHVPRSELLDTLAEVASSDFLTEGKFVRKFEDAVSEWADQRAVAVNSCGSGLFALFRQFKPCTVLVPANTFFATGAMAKEAGHHVKLVDCAPNDFAVGVDQLQEAFDECRKAGYWPGLAVLTHVGWLAKQYEEIAAWCAHMKIPLIEDAAHVLGAESHYRIGHFDKQDHKLVAGALGCAAVFSLYPTKAVPAGEGGCIVTRDCSLAEQVAQFRNYGKEKVAGQIKYNAGFNLRMDEWTAAVACLQMERLGEIRERRADAAMHLGREVPLHPAVPTDGTMWYKYPTDAADLPLAVEAGKIYQLSDQLPEAMGIEGVLPNAVEIACGHRCVPIGEGQPNLDLILKREAA